jgi:hypothetical protein
LLFLLAAAYCLCLSLFACLLLLLLVVFFYCCCCCCCCFFFCFFCAFLFLLLFFLSLNLRLLITLLATASCSYKLSFLLFELTFLSATKCYQFKQRRREKINKSCSFPWETRIGKVWLKALKPPYLDIVIVLVEIHVLLGNIHMLGTRSIFL